MMIKLKEKLSTGNELKLTEQEKRFSFLQNFIFYMLVCIVALAIGYLSLGKNYDFSVYPALEGDGAFFAALVKNIQENGIVGLYFNDRIGAPEVSALIDFPVQDILMSLIIWGISLFVSSTSKIIYIYYIITFLLDALSMSLLLRKLKINYTATFVFSLLFAAAPYHFMRNIGHATLINYMSFPIAVYLALYILGIVEEEKKDRWKLCVSIILLGLGYGYYYAFGLILLAVAYLIKFIQTENKKDIFKKLWVIISLLMVIALSLLPKLIYSFINGSNEIVGVRYFFEQEIYGLKIIQLLLPPSYSRFTWLGNITATYNASAPLVNENGTSCLGLVASIGFCILCVMLIISLCSNHKKNNREEWLLIDFLSLSALTLVLTGAIGGFGEIFNWIVTSQIRCYNRSSIYIAGLSLIVLAVFINKLKKKKLLYILCCLIMVIGYLDQVPAYTESNQESMRILQTEYENFFSEVEDSLDENVMVYQLPYIDFPEVDSSLVYKHLIGYLFTDTIRWSHGGVKGRNLAASELNVDEGMSYTFLQGIIEAGFDAVYIDLEGYEDGGAEILAFYERLDIEPIVSESGTLYLYDISELEISSEMLVAGYSFVDEWADTYGMDISMHEKSEIAAGLRNMDESTYALLYSSIEDTDIVNSYSDSEYVDFLYSAVLGRTESDEEQTSWVDRIQKGVSRETAFYQFLGSEEFRTKWQLN